MNEFVEATETAREGQAEAVKENGLCLIRFGHVPQADHFLDTIGGLGRQDDIAAFDFRQVVQ